MLLIPCPFCGHRCESEFAYGGEAHKARPAYSEAQKQSEKVWAEYLFMQGNKKGLYHERWMHSAGCRRWFNVIRDTVSSEVLTVYKMGEAPPDISQTGDQDKATLS